MFWAEHEVGTEVEKGGGGGGGAEPRVLTQQSKSSLATAEIVWDGCLWKSTHGQQSLEPRWYWLRSKASHSGSASHTAAHTDGSCVPVYRPALGPPQRYPMAVGVGLA